MNKKTQVIIFCGLDGSGKTTQANKLVEYFRNNKIKFHYSWMRYPNKFSLPFAAFLRIMNLSGYPIPETKKKSGIKNLSSHETLKKWWKKVVLYDLKLVSKSKVFKPLKEGHILILDRFVIDTVVELAINTGEESLIEKILQDFSILIPENSKIFFLDVEPDISYQRNKEESIEVLRRKRNLYLKLCEILNISVIDAKNSIQTIHEMILKECGFYQK